VRKLHALFFVLLLVLASLPCLQAAQTVNTVQYILQDNQLNIVYPKFDYFKWGRTFYLQFHVFDSNATMVRNTTCRCLLHVYNSTDRHILERNVSFDTNRVDFFQILNTTIIKAPGFYSFILQCNNSPPNKQAQFGFISNSFEVTRTGEQDEPSTRQGTNILIACILIAAFYIGIGLVSKEVVPKFFSFGMAGIQAMIAAFIVYGIEMGNTIIPILRINFWAYLVTFFGIGMFALYSAVQDMINPPKEHENKKWEK